MKTTITREQALRWTTQGLLVLLVLAVAYIGVLYFRLGEIETSMAQSDKAAQESGAALAKTQAQLKATNAKVAELEAKQREAEDLKVLLAKLESQIIPVLEAAGKAGKPEARAAAVAGVGLIGQMAHGVNYDPAVGALVRALSIDKSNCVASLAVSLAGAKTIEIAPDCQALLPGAAAAEAKPAADTKPAASPAGDTGKAAAPAGKS
jgi:hypothetical protein